MSGVQPGDPIILHQYRDGQTLCGGRWYDTSESPCEIAEATNAEALRNLPPCEASDEDLLAAAALLGQPRASRCWTKDRASWDDPALNPEKVQAQVLAASMLQQLQSGIISKAEAYRRLGFDA